MYLCNLRNSIFVFVHSRHRFFMVILHVGVIYEYVCIQCIWQWQAVPGRKSWKRPVFIHRHADRYALSFQLRLFRVHVAKRK